MFPPTTLIGHRGLADVAPENTLAALHAAASAQLTWVEVDSRPSADGTAVLSHDADLLCPDGTTCPISHQTAEQIRTAAIQQADFTDDPLQRPFPTLAEALQKAGELRLAVVVEIKADSAGIQASAEAASRAVMQIQGTTSLMISSFSRRIIARMQHLLPAIPRALTCDAVPDNWSELANQLQLVGFHCHHRRATVQITRQLADAGLGLAAYTVNDVERAKTLWKMGLEGVFTDGLLP